LGKLAVGKITSPEPVEIESHVAEILESAAFRASARSQQFLQYVVTETIAGRADSLKERVIGERVFCRQADYDTGQDSIVRVKASEVRRRLAQYYEKHPNAPLRIDMVSGSYAVRVRYADASVPTTVANVPVKEPARQKLWWAGGAAAAAVVLLTISLQRAPSPQAAALFEEFWKPFLASTEPLLLCLPAPEAFRIYGADKEKLVHALKPRPPGSAAPAVTTTWQDVRIVPEQNLLLGVGDARAMAMLQAFATMRNKEVKTRLSAMTSYADLKAAPSVVIGGETNQWSKDLAEGHRFQFAKEQGRNMIWDRHANRAVCEKPASWEGPSKRDCALVTRLGKATTGSVILLAAGLDHYGTYALGDFLTNPRLLEPVLNSAAKGWESQNLQILLEVERMGDGIGPPRIRAVHTW